MQSKRPGSEPRRRRVRLAVDSLEARSLFTALVSYDAAALTATAAALQPTAVSDVTASNLTRAMTGTTRLRVAGWASRRGAFSATPGGAYATTADAAVKAGQYFQFSLSPVAGKSLSVSDVQAAPFLQTSLIRQSGNWAVQYRADDDADAANGNGGTWAMSDEYIALQSNDAPALTRVPLTDLSDVRGAGVDFRIVIWNGLAWSASNLGGLGGAEVVVDGEVRSVGVVTKTSTSTAVAPETAGELPTTTSVAPSSTTGITAADAPPTTPASFQVASKLRAVANMLTWIDRSSDEAGFVIQRATDAAFTTGLTAFTLPANTTSFVDTTAVVGVTYSYRVQAQGAGETASSAFTAAVAHLTMEKLNPVMYSIAASNTGEPTSNVATYWAPEGTIVNRTTTAQAFAGMTGDAFIMDNETSQYAEIADSVEYLKAMHPGKWVGSYAVSVTDYYAPLYLEQHDLGIIPLTQDPGGFIARWDAADAAVAPIRNAANILAPSLYLLDTNETPAQYAEDARIAKYTVARAKALAPGKPVMPYLTLNTFNSTNMKITYAPMSLARWTNLLKALKAAGADAVCLWSGGGTTTVPWTVTDPAQTLKYPGWKPYAQIANQIFDA